MEIRPEEVRITVCKSDHQTNLGGWSLELPAGISLFHIPTSIYVQCTKHRSQHKNKAEALEELERLVGLYEISKLDQEGGLYE